MKNALIKHLTITLNWRKNAWRRSNMAYVYIKEEEGFVVKKKKSEVLPNETIITEEEYAEGIT